MSFDEKLASRVRRLLRRKTGFSERKMFGGLCFTLSGHMCGGVLNDDLIVRVGPENYEAALKRPYTRKFDFTGKPLTGFVVVTKKGCISDKTLTDWVALGTRCARSQPAKTTRKKRQIK